MSRRHAVIVATVGACAVLFVLGVVAAVAAPRPADSGNWAVLAAFGVPVLTFAAVGGLIAWRRPGTIGGLLAAIGLLWAVVTFASGVASWALRTDHLTKNAAEWISVLSNCWVFALGLTATQLPLRLPYGRLLSPGWRRFSHVCALVLVLAFAGIVLTPDTVEGVPGTHAPLGIEAARPLGAIFALVLPCALASIASLVVRYRGSGAHERAQLRWIATGGVGFLTVYLVLAPLNGVFGERGHSTFADVVTVITEASFALLPLAIGSAILRHRLYDIDVVINRALVYGALTALLAGTYLVTVLVLQLVLPSRSGLSVAVSTLATAAAFRPARARVQASVDQRFFRRRYDAARTLERFGTQVRDEVSLDAIGIRLRDVIDETVAPAHVSLWLRAPTAATSRSTSVSSL